MQIYLIFFLEGHYFLDIQYVDVGALATVIWKGGGILFMFAQ